MARKLNFKEKILKKIKWHKKRTLTHTLIALFLCFILIIPFSYLFKPGETEAIKDDALVTATMVGDIMMGRYVEKATGEYGTDHPFKYVSTYFKNSDYVTGNFENPVVLDENTPAVDKSVTLKTSEESAKALDRANFTVANLANNHMLDYGIEGLEDTLSTFKSLDTGIVGAGDNLDEAKQIHYTKVNGIKIATLGFNDIFEDDSEARDTKGGVLPASPKNYIPMIGEAKQNADLVFVHMHWGQEYENGAHPRQEEIAHAISEAGADIIVGHGSHVLSTIERYNDTVIFYSLGSFVFDQGWSRSRDTALVQYRLYKDGTGEIEVIPAYIRNTQPRPLTDMNWYNNAKITRQLTKNLDKEAWTKRGGNIILPVDHSRVLKGATIVGE
ncbi:CapA family protein [Bacillus sp. NTK071]|uniref:CapA family protein n=1 Tax=Bacillus sp. NTK071 TaxID=2802175 RepID=UPI001A8EE97F|nr:CapA family protein [Bacillus sp. NTK071]MBN8209840.1 CapA family protein [Bacillus sp. NTK071]